MTTCLPLRVNDEAIGLIQLHSRQTVPAPPTHHVRQLLEAIDEVAPLIRLSREHAHPTTPVADAQYDVPARRSTPVSQNPNTPPLLQFHCFGHFELLRAGTIITPHMFKRRKALTLLKMLLLHAEQPLHKETLIEWLWPGSDPEAGANRLYVVVHALRAMLQPADANDAAAVIHTRADHYVFEPGTASSLDLTDFQVAVDTGRRAEERNDPSTALAAYTAAENVYRGDLFADEPFAEWCVLEREQLREVYLDVLQRHARLAHDVGDLTRAIDVYRRVVQMEPLREEVQRRLIACLWSARRRDEALHQYDLLRECLLRELDISPLPETEELVARIRNDH